MTGIFIGVSLVWLILSVLTNYGYIEKDSKLWHWTSAWTRGLLSAYICDLVFVELWRALSVCLLFNTIWWIAFDMGLNYKRKLPIFYVGTGTIDLTFKLVGKLIKMDPEIMMFIVKLLSLLMTIVFLIIQFHPK